MAVFNTDELDSKKEDVSVNRSDKSFEKNAMPNLDAQKDQVH